jgi:hypothetical protein
MDRSHGWTLVGILALSAVLSVAFNLAQPIWEAPDETAHFGYVRYLQLNGALPRATPDPHPLSRPWNTTNEYSQTPLYYVLLALVLDPLNLAPDAAPHLNPYVAWPGHPWRYAVALHRADEGWPYAGLARFVHAGRLVSTAFGVIALLATFAMLLTLTNSPNLALFGAAWLALSPVYLLASSRLNNDVGALATGAITLWLTSRLLTAGRFTGLATLGAVSVSLTAALLTKIDTAFLVPLILIASGYAAAPREPLTYHVGRRLGVAVAVVFLPVATLAAWWIGYGRSAGSAVGVKVGVGVLNPLTVARGLNLHDLLGALWSLNSTWWGGNGFGSLNPWPAALDVALAAAVAVLVGVAFRSRSKTTGRIPRKPFPQVFGLLIVSTLPLWYATIVRAAVPAIGLDSNARFVLPAAPVVALLVASGMTAIAAGRAQRILAVSYLAVMLLLDVVMVVVSLPTIDAPAIPARLSTPEYVQGHRPIVSFTNGVDLVAIAGVPDKLTPSSQVSLDFTWNVRSAPQRDFTAFIQVLDVANDRRIAAVDAIPVADVFPPRIWQPGEIVDERRSFTLPGVIDPGRYVLLVGAYYNLGTNGLEPIDARAATASGATIALREWNVPAS